jgi:hypothetical protein
VTTLKALAIAATFGALCGILAALGSIPVRDRHPP